MKEKKFLCGQKVYIVLDPQHHINITAEDIIGVAGKAFRIIESMYAEDIEEYEYLLAGITPWIPQHCLRKEIQILTVTPDYAIRALEEEIDKAIVRNDKETFKELSKKYALLKADFV